MADSRVFKDMVIASHKGPYRVTFDEDAIAKLGASPVANAHVLIDSHVADLYAQPLAGLLSGSSVLRLAANEDTKALDRFPAYVEHLVNRGIRRDHVLIAIGGGVIQDTTCFLAATLLRGVAWRFYPTTLLAQADSCIGSKSSINCGTAKNILGTFTPPSEVVVSTRFLDTLDPRDLRSGIGEMLKVHAIEGPQAFAAIAADFPKLQTNRDILLRYIARSLEIKKRYIEEDEFDKGVRNVFNYGHSFGHAIEAATDFAVPHGIAVAIGMDMANHVAANLGQAAKELAANRHGVLKANFQGYEKTPVPLDRFLAAMGKDKKNTGAGTVTVILPDQNGAIRKTTLPADDRFRALCRDYLEITRQQ